MWYKNIAGRFFGLVTKHTCDRRTDGRTDRQTDRITTPKTALSIARAVKTTCAQFKKFATAENKQGKKEEEDRKKERRKNHRTKIIIMACPITGT